MWRDILRSRLRRPASDTQASDVSSAPDAEIAGLLAARLHSVAQRRLGRSLAVLHASAGGCGGCALEIGALLGTSYDLERHGLSFVSSPRHADVLLVTGAMTQAMRGPLERAWTAMPDPKWLVAAGACAIDGGMFVGSYAVEGGIGDVLPVDIIVPGCPPSPAMILTALLTLVAANG